jgi:Domain of unknown function (DUF4365)
MMDDNTKKEQFSYTYIKLLASISGLLVIEAARPLDNAGIDITIRAPGMIKGILSPSIDAQVKCTARDVIKSTVIKYPLPINNYTRLISKSINPQILIIVTMPTQIADCVNILDLQNETLVKSCAYWISLKGRQETKNDKTITIEIPRGNVLTPDVIRKLIEDEADNKNRLLSLEEPLE